MWPRPNSILTLVTLKTKSCYVNFGHATILNLTLVTLETKSFYVNFGHAPMLNLTLTTLKAKSCCANHAPLPYAPIPASSCPQPATTRRRSRIRNSPRSCGHPHTMPHFLIFGLRRSHFDSVVELEALAKATGIHVHIKPHLLCFFISKPSLSYSFSYANPIFDMMTLVVGRNPSSRVQL